MTTDPRRKEALEALLKRVETGLKDNDGSAFRIFGEDWTKFFDAERGSLDAALAFHQAVLPGWGWCVTSDDATVYSPDGEWLFEGDTDTPARAWLIAILKALIAQEKA